MDLLNNVNVVISIIVGLITIFGSLAHLLIKVNLFQRRQAALLAPSSGQVVHHPAALSLNWCDWMEVLWGGVMDCFKARKGKGWITSAQIGIVGGIATAMVSSLFGSGIFYIFITLFTCIHILFYVYFVGRRIEKKEKRRNQYIARRLKSTSSY